MTRSNPAAWSDIFKFSRHREDRPSPSSTINSSKLSRTESTRSPAELLEQLLVDEILRRQKQNLPKRSRSARCWRKTLQRYHSRIIDAAAVVQEMINMRQEMEAK